VAFLECRKIHFLEHS